MRVGTIYGDVGSCGRNDGAPLYFNGMLKELFGAENVTHIFPKGDMSILGKHDLYFMADWGEDALGYQDFEMPHPSVYIASDTHLGFDYRLSRAKRVDHVFCNQKRAVEEFAVNGVGATWLPHAYDPLAYSPGVWNDKRNCFDMDTVPLKKYDICFIGNLNDRNRVEHLDILFKSVPNFYWGNQRFHLASQKFNESKIVFNVSCKDDVNMRCFEALGSRSFMLTNDIPNLHDLFKDGKHLVMYKDHKDMVDKARYYLEHDDERERIAEAGWQLVSGRDTYMHRLCSILDSIGVEYDPGKAKDYLEKFRKEKETCLA